MGLRTSHTLGIGALRALSKSSLGVCEDRFGLPNFIRIALACIEIAAALLFLIPRATVAGGWLLLGVLAAAIVLHLLHGWYDVGALLVYSAATWDVMAGQHVRVSGRGQL